jgi:hypothetical protein
VPGVTVSPVPKLTGFDVAAAFHEGKALDAVIRFIEARDQVARSDGRDPEAERHAAPVDYACRLGGKPFAFEHTGIEAFAGQLKQNVDTAELLDPVVERLAGIAPADETLQLLLPVDATVGLTRRDVPHIQKAIEGYVREAAPKIGPVRYGRPGKFAPVRLEGVSFEVTLRRFKEAGPMGGTFYYTRFVSGDREAARIKRLAEACGKKFGKLAVWKAEGARTILILEDIDLSLTNEALVASALVEAERGRDDRPDEVYMVNACTSVWFVTCLRREGKSYLDGDNGDPVFELDPEKLDRLTPR